MKSFIAALRNLVLPYGRTSGQRIVLDGDNGQILVYDSTNTLAVAIQSASPAGITVFGPNGMFNVADADAVWESVNGSRIEIVAGAAQALEALTPPDVVGVTWDAGTFGTNLSADFGSNTPSVFLQSPSDDTNAAKSSIKLLGGAPAPGTNGRRIDLTGNLRVLDSITTYSSWTTFTPTWNNLGSGTLSTNLGWYKFIDDIFFYEIYAVASAAGSGTTPVTITGLPFTPFRAGNGANTTRQAVTANVGGVAAGTNASTSGSFSGLVLAGGTAGIDRLIGPTSITLNGENVGASFVATIQGWMRST